MHAAQVCDLKALTDIAHAHGALVMVDSSIMTPIFQKPLDLGADISMVSATKFVGGHSDVTGGILSFKDPELAKKYASLSLLYSCHFARCCNWCMFQCATKRCRVEVGVPLCHHGR
jgi:cysteine-S-conjugate beta-lyase